MAIDPQEIPQDEQDALKALVDGATWAALTSEQQDRVVRELHATEHSADLREGYLMLLNGEALTEGPHLAALSDEARTRVLDLFALQPNSGHAFALLLALAALESAAPDDALKTAALGVITRPLRFRDASDPGEGRYVRADDLSKHAGRLAALAQLLRLVGFTALGAEDRVKAVTVLDHTGPEGLGLLWELFEPGGARWAYSEFAADRTPIGTPDFVENQPLLAMLHRIATGPLDWRVTPVHEGIVARWIPNPAIAARAAAEERRRHEREERERRRLARYPQRHPPHPPATAAPRATPAPAPATTAQRRPRHPPAQLPERIIMAFGYTRRSRTDRQNEPWSLLTPDSTTRGFWRDYEESLRRSVLLGALVCELARPDQFLNQDNRGTCELTSVLHRQATMRPAEYARLAADLLLGSYPGRVPPLQHARLSDGHDARVPDDALDADGSFRSASERLTQAMLAEYWVQSYRSNLHYRNVAPRPHGDRTNRSGTSADFIPEVDPDPDLHAMPMIRAALHGNYRLVRHNMIATLRAHFRDHPAVPVFAGLRWGIEPDGTRDGHMVDLLGLDESDPRHPLVRYWNPWGAFQMVTLDGFPMRHSTRNVEDEGERATSEWRARLRAEREHRRYHAPRPARGEPRRRTVDDARGIQVMPLQDLRALLDVLVFAPE